MKRKSFLFPLISIFVLGFIVGVGFSAWKLSGVMGTPQTEAPKMSKEQAAGLEIMGRISGIEKMLASNPNNIQALIQLGNDYFDLNNHQRAVDYYTKALQIEPNNPDVWTDLAISLRRLGKTQESVTAFKKALEYNPNHQLALFNLGILLRDDLKDDDGALAVWEKFLSAGPDSPHAVMITPWVKQLREKLGKTEEEEVMGMRR